MDQPRVLWLNGTITINGTDVGTISASDGPVEIDMGNQQVSASGSRGVDLYTDTVKKEYQIIVTGAFYDMQMLQYLEGLAVSFGTLEDGVTPSQNYSMDSQCNSLNRPYVQLLITAQKKGTSNTLVAPSDPRYGLPYRMQIWTSRAMLVGSMNIGMSKSDFTKLKLTFKCHGEQDESAIWFQIRDEEQES
jgi:hypothetical protein